MQWVCTWQYEDTHCPQERAKHLIGPMAPLREKMRDMVSPCAWKGPVTLRRESSGRSEASLHKAPKMNPPEYSPVAHQEDEDLSPPDGPEEELSSGQLTPTLSSSSPEPFPPQDLLPPHPSLKTVEETLFQWPVQGWAALGSRICSPPFSCAHSQW